MRRFVWSMSLVIVVALSCSADGDTSGAGASGTGATGAGATGGTGAAAGEGGDGAGAAAGGGNGGSGGDGAVGGGGSAASGGGGSGGNAGPQCTTGADCTIVNDCCSCLALGANEPSPACNIFNCLQSSCSAQGVLNPQPDCQAGHCVIGFDCDHATVVCGQPPPSCPPGETASVDGSCWGACVEATECDFVSDCEECAADDSCVAYVTQLGYRYHCVPVPTGCNGDESCACMGGAVCLPPFDSCADAADGPSCSCPDC